MPIYVPEIGAQVEYRLDSSTYLFGVVESVSPGIIRVSIGAAENYVGPAAAGLPIIESTAVIFDDTEPLAIGMARLSGGSKRSQADRYAARPVLLTSSALTEGWSVLGGLSVDTIQQSIADRSTLISYADHQPVTYFKIWVQADIGDQVEVVVTSVGYLDSSQLPVTTEPILSAPSTGLPGQWLPIIVPIGIADKDQDPADLRFLIKITSITGDLSPAGNWLVRGATANGGDLPTP